MNEASVYEKQLLWKKASNLKAEKLREDANLANSSSFAPTVFTHPVKQFEGRARELTEASTQRHVERHSRGRKGKPSFERSDLPEIEDFRHEGYYSGDNDDAGDGYGAHFVNRSHSSEDHQETDSLSEESHVVDEPIVELLERERKQWQLEREKLLQCIHLQQLELTQRSIAAHERAADIAKEFARAIEGFEERLVSVESNVQKEIMSIKSIAESILQATTNNSVQNK